MTLFELVKQNICVPDAAEHYGLQVNRNGMCRCPFHEDRHPSMKLNERYFYCFGCGATGDVIDLVARLFDLSNYEAAQKLAQDFGIDPDKPPAAIALAVIIALVLFVLLIRPDATFLQKVGRTAGILLCVAAAFFLVRPLVLDIPYLKRPEAAYLERLEFEYSRGIGDYGSDDYYLRGVDMTGERHSFEISEKRYEEGRALWGGNDYNLFAKVTYLPHTSTLMSLEFMTELDASGAELYPPSPELPNDWESFSIQINDTVYTLPVPLAAFLDDGWVISEEDAGLSLAGAEGPYASYEWEWVSLTNDHEQDISVCVFNTTESTIPVAESTVGGIHVIYGNYDFSGTELRLPGGLMLGWATREDVLKLYGQPNDSFEATYGGYRLTYEIDDPLDPASWKIGFDDSGILDDVMVHHQAYFRSD